MENRQITQDTISVTFEQQNAILFMDSLNQLDPGLYLIKKYLVEFKINPSIVPPLIKALARLDEVGYGSVETEMRDHKISKVIIRENVKLDDMEVRS